MIAAETMPTCGLCPAFLFDPDSLAARRCFGCRSGPPTMRLEAPASRFTWIPDRALENWRQAYVQMSGRDRQVSLVRVREQPRYWLFFRDDGNAGLIIGPTDEAGAKAAAERWLLSKGAVSA
jgi:hypothetical protein